jgi:uncharacterized protein YwgA
MTKKNEMSWDQLGLITKIVQRIVGKNSYFGKTALQKIVYLLQELFDVNSGYDFNLHNFGPFSRELANDLDLVESLNGVKLEYYRASPFPGYMILPGEEANAIEEKAKSFLNIIDKNIEKVIQEFGGYNAKELELRATIVFFDRDLRYSKRTVSKNDFVNLIKQVKPRFDLKAIDRVVTEMESRAYIGIRE